MSNRTTWLATALVVVLVTAGCGSTYVDESLVTITAPEPRVLEPMMTSRRC
jgi:hypothetical protein